MVRSLSEWHIHPQAKAIAKLPLLEMTRGDKTKAEPFAKAKRPLSGLRVLDLTRVIAGPMAGRTLAEYGADVIRISSPELPSIEALVIDTGYGKRAAFIDLETERGVKQLKELISKADVFIQAYRPNSITARGFSFEELQALRPGIICVNLSAYGRVGPWAERRGFDTLVQSATGIADESGSADGPKHLPTQALDYLSGYLTALSVLAALIKRATAGGAYKIELSLAQTGQWLRNLGKLPTSSVPWGGEIPKAEDIPEYLMQTDSTFGRIEHLKPVGGPSETAPYWASPPVPLGTHRPVWTAL